jgi:multiple sugar transport system permease protein
LRKLAASNPATDPARPHPRPGRATGAEGRFGLLLLVPVVVFYLVVILYPLARAVVLSLYRLNQFSVRPVFAGLENFRAIFSDPTLSGTWLTTLTFVVCATALSCGLGLGWAIIMNQEFRGRTVVRTLSLIPWVLPSTVTAFLWAWILNSQNGILNAILLNLGLIHERVAWLATGSNAMLAIVVARAWMMTPWFMVLFLAALQTLPREQVEAARVDGARNRAVLRFIVLPHLRYTGAVALVLGAMGNFQQFDIIYALTGGGPVRATTTLSIEVYRQAFQNWNTGLASAIGVLWLATIAVPAFLYLRSIFRQVNARP